MGQRKIYIVSSIYWSEKLNKRETTSLSLVFSHVYTTMLLYYRVWYLRVLSGMLWVHYLWWGWNWENLIHLKWTPTLSNDNINNLAKLKNFAYCRLNMSDYIQSKGHIQLAHDMAVQSMVLLKNDPNNSLPITSPYKKACVSFNML